MSDFQTQVNINQPPAVEGDFASANPRASVLAGAGALVAGAGGVIVGRFAWADMAAGTAVNTGSGVPTGFVHREQQALITVFLAKQSLVVPVGLMVVLHQAGDFWARAANDVTIGDKVYANLADGSISTAATGNPGQAFSATGSMSLIAAVPTLTVTALASGTISVGDLVSGTGIPAGTYIAKKLTGTGSTGTYQLGFAAGVAATPFGARTITGSGTIETKWYAMSSCLAGELFKMSSWPLG